MQGVCRLGLGFELIRNQWLWVEDSAVKLDSQGTTIQGE